MQRRATPRLATARLDLVPLAPAAAPEMALVLADPRLYEHIGGQPPTADELAERYRRWAVGPSGDGEAWLNWAIRTTSDGQAIGHLQATIIERGGGADIAWMIGTPWQARGFATEAARALVTWLDEAGVGTITAHIHAANRGSERVAERVGLAPTEVVEDGERVWRRERATP